MGKFDALALPVDEPARMVIVHPITRQPLRDGEGNEAYVLVHSGDSDIARQHNRTVQRRRLAMRGRGRLTPEELEAEAADIIVALTKGWRLLTLDGEPLDIEFSQSNARELYTTPSMIWLREQVDEFAADRANFSKASSTS